ncbi:hypothetical protein [Stenotrophomonas bentonitica]
MNMEKKPVKSEAAAGPEAVARARANNARLVRSMNVVFPVAFGLGQDDTRSPHRSRCCLAFRSIFPHGLQGNALAAPEPLGGGETGC